MKRKYTNLCRYLRKNQTDAEQILWTILRGRRFAGIKFRRQFSKGRYILDFYCPEIKLCIEADGGGHYHEKNVKKDECRSDQLSKCGIKILRFSNRDIFENIDGVCKVILDFIKKAKNSPSP